MTLLVPQFRAVLLVLDHRSSTDWPIGRYVVFKISISIDADLSVSRSADSEDGAIIAAAGWVVARGKIEGGDSIAIECRRLRNVAVALAGDLLGA